MPLIKFLPTTVPSILLYFYHHNSQTCYTKEFPIPTISYCIKSRNIVMAGCVFFNDAKSKLKLTATLFRNNTNIGFNVGKHTEVVPDTWSHEFLTLRPPKNVVKDFFPVLETITISVPTIRFVGTLRSISTCDFKEVLNYLYSPARRQLHLFLSVSVYFIHSLKLSFNFY